MSFCLIGWLVRCLRVWAAMARGEFTGWTAEAGRLRPDTGCRSTDHPVTGGNVGDRYAATVTSWGVTRRTLEQQLVLVKEQNSLAWSMSGHLREVFRSARLRRQRRGNDSHRPSPPV